MCFFKNKQYSNDRIIEINSIKLIVQQNYISNRRNIICKSKKFEEYIKNEINSNINSFELSIQVGNLLNKYRENLNDIEIIKIDGFY